MASTMSLNFSAYVLDKALGNEQTPKHSPTKKRKMPVTLKNQDGRQNSENKTQ